MTKILEQIAADYGKTEEELVSIAVEYYIQNNSIPISFKYEHEFQKYIEVNLNKIEDGLILKASSYRFDRGELDILCNYSAYKERHLIIEVKFDADYSSIGQLLFYLGSLNNDERFIVNDINSFHDLHGMIVCINASESLIRATHYYNRNKPVNESIRIFKFNTNNRKFIEIKEAR